MSRRILALTPVFVLGMVLVGVTPPAPAAEEVLSEEQTLRTAHLPTDNDALVNFFKKRASLEADQDKVAALIKQLGDKSPEVRDKAAGELVAIGTPAIRLLHVAANDLDDQQVAAGAKKCLEFLEGGNGVSLPIAAARLLAIRQPAGAVQVLLDYLPSADDDNVVEEIKSALTALAIRDNKPDPALVKALEDPKALRRVAAVEALCQTGREEIAEIARKLLDDKNKVVQLRASLALANFRDAKAVDTLIKIMGELPLAEAKQAEEYLLVLASEQSPKATMEKDGDQKKCAEAWSAWWKKTQGPELLKEFTKRTLPDGDRDTVTALIKKLGDDKFEVRDQAENDLVKLATTAAPLLRQTLGNSTDPEVLKRVKTCLSRIGTEAAAPCSPVTARLVALHKPEGAAEAILGYLPFAEDDSISGEIRATLAVVAYRGGKADPAVLKALADKSPIRRAAAAEALCQAGGDEHREAIRKLLLKDEDMTVRVRAGIALANAKDKEAIPPLIAMLGEAPYEVASQAEEYLREVAGEGAPNAALDKTDAGKKKCMEAWDGWWKKNSATVALGRNASTTHQLGYTLLICINPNTGLGELVELGTDNKPRWSFGNLQYPFGAQVLPNNHVLVAEHNGMRVTERDSKGTETWQRRCNSQPVSVQRLSNGNTFIAARGQMIEIDRAGKEVFTFNRPNQDIIEAKKLKNGQYAYVTQNGEYGRIDSAGKAVKTARGIGSYQWYGCGIDILPNDHILYPLYNQNQVIEYDGDGKQVWKCDVQLPTSAMRLPNGNTLVASQQSQTVTEINKAGKKVKEFKGTYFPIRAVRR
jgi:HEAT repeat protein